MTPDSAELMRLAGLLGSSDQAARERAARALARAGSAALPILEGVLDSGGSAERLFACRALGLMGSDAAAAAPRLLRAIEDPSELVRWAAADTLLRIGAASEELWPVLVEAAESAQPALRLWAARGLHDVPLDPAEAGPVLAQWLQADQPVVRTLAAQGLVRLGQAGVPFIQAALGHPDAAVRWWAAAALGALGARAEPAAAVLAHQLEDPAWEVALEAALSLLRIGRETAPAVRRLVRLLHSPEIVVREGSAAALGRLDPELAQKVVIPELVSLLACEDREEAWTAGEVLVRFGAAAVPALEHAVESGDRPARLLAVRALGQTGTAAEGAIPLLTRLLEEPDRAVRYGAANALLGVASAQGQGVILALRDALADADAALRTWAAEAAGRLGQEQAQALREPLLTLLSDPDEGVRMAAAGAMRGVAPEMMDQGLRPLRESLRGGDAELRRRAAATLQALGPAAATLAPDLVVALADAESAVRQAAGAALAGLGPGAVPSLVSALRDGSAPVQRDVARYLAEAPAPLRESALAELSVLVEVGSSEARLHAARALVDLGQVDARIVEVLIDSLNSKKADEIWHAQQALGRVDRRTTSDVLVPALLTALREPDRRLGAVEILPRLGREALPGLVAALSDDDPAVRFWAADVLGRMSKLALDAVPALAAATRDPDRAVRDRARTALLRVSSGTAP